MLVALWIVGGLAAVMFLAAGGMKVVASKSWLGSHGLAWVESYTAGFVKLIGVLEVLGAVGIVVALLLEPTLGSLALVGIVVAATGLVILMVGAVSVHARRHEPVIAPLVPGAVALATSVLSAVLLAS